MTSSGSDVVSLIEQARARGPAELTAIGKRLLVGDQAPLAIDLALRILREAADGGVGQAARLLAVCAAWGVGQQRDVSAALDWLVRAAQLGLSEAARELRLLARSDGADPGLLRSLIDVTAWTKAPEGRRVRDRPRIIVFERFLSPAECDWVIELGGSSLERAKVYRGSAAPQVGESRTNREASFTIFNADVALNLIRERISAASRAPTAFLEIAKLLNYEPGQQFALHADFIEPRTPELEREIQRRGQRAATFLVYLNEDYEGGETNFPRLAFRFKGRRGDALLFSNIDPAGAPDYETVHAGLPPTSGRKWVLSQWIRTRPVGAS